MNDAALAHSCEEHGWNWKIVWLIRGMHLGAIAALPFFTWEAAVLLATLYLLTGFGVTVGNHRFFTHKSFKTWPPVKWALAILGALSGEGDIIGWVAKHNLHHKHSDTPEDPHSPSYGGFWHSHVRWMMKKNNPQLRYAGKAILSDRFLKGVHAWYSALHIGLIVVLAAAGASYGWFARPDVFAWYRGEWTTFAPAWSSAFFAASFVGYGYFLRVVLVLNATWCVNSLSHMYGQRPFQEYATDDSRNNWFVAIVALGEGWHRNHHVSPKSYRHGIEWWQFDPSAWIIWSMWKCGLAWDLKPFKLSSVRGEAEIDDRD